MNPKRPGNPLLRLPRALAFLLALACMVPAALAAASEDPPIVRRTILGVTWETVPARPCSGQDVSLRFMLCECEVDLKSAVFDSTQGLVLSLAADPSIRCVTCRPDTVDVPLGQLNAGTFSYQAKFIIDYLTAPPDTSWPASPAYDVLVFSVAQTCSPPGETSYLERVVIGGRPAPCATCPSVACPGDSIDVLLTGTFPHDCIQLSGVELIPSMIVEPQPPPYPLPPTVRLTYGINSCILRVCAPIPQPWAARVRLPALPPIGGLVYDLPVEEFLRDFCLPDSIGARIASHGFPFVVADSCSTSVPPGEACFNTAWRAVTDSAGWDGGGRRIGCVAPWIPGGSSFLDLGVGSRVPIAGVEGALRLENGGALRVAGVQALWPGWQAAFSNDGSGHFIAFAGPGATPLPASDVGRPVPFLRVEVAHNPLLDVVTPDQVYLSVFDLIVSDPRGHGIDPCPEPAIYPPSNIAVLCRQVACDANADGQADVRDLVVMINCLAPPANVFVTCPVDSTGGTLDCDRNDRFDLDDVFCCVRWMLGGDGPPDSTGGVRDAPEIAVRFGLPREAGDGTIDVPVRLGGWSAVAAARLDIAYPDSRYELVDVRFAGTPASWWTHHAASAGRARLAILDLGALAGDQPVPLSTMETSAILRLRLRTGASPGGELSVASSDFAAGDGIRLSTPNASPRLALAGGAGIALSVARPNPFVAATSIALTLPVAGPVDVAVFAANGRRVATLLRESAAAAGVYDLVWDGRQDAGSRAPAGVYFVRVVGGQADMSRKVLYLPGGTR